MQAANDVFESVWNWTYKYIGTPIARAVTSPKLWQGVSILSFWVALFANITNLVLGIERADRGLTGFAVAGLAICLILGLSIVAVKSDRNRAAKMERLIASMEKANRDIEGYRERLRQQVEDNERAIYKSSLNTTPAVPKGYDT